jgi:NADPH:quinone reductase-like Zn-dependent oxidoreductase
LAAQLVPTQLAADDEPCDLLFDTVGGAALDRAARSSGRVVSVAEEREGVTYFVVEPSRSQLLHLTDLVEIGVLKPRIDSVFPLEEAREAFARVAERGKRGKVVIRVVTDSEAAVDP